MTDKTLILNQVLEKIFEDFAFMFIDPVPAGCIQKPQGEAYVQATITFVAEQEQGRLSVLASMDFCRCLSRNILGMEPEEALDPGIAESGLSELINVACGSLTEALYGTGEVVDLEPPVQTKCSGRDWELFMAEKSTLVLLVDDYPVGFRLDVTLNKGKV
jgi:CheY-specific phosphatase CheX